MPLFQSSVAVLALVVVKGLVCQHCCVIQEAGTVTDNREHDGGTEGEEEEDVDVELQTLVEVSSIFVCWCLVISNIISKNCVLVIAGDWQGMRRRRRVSVRRS